VHREHALRRQQVVERGEDRLLDLAGVTRAADDHDLLSEVDQDEGLALGAIARRVGLHGGQRDHGEVRLELHLLISCGPDEQVAGEQAVPGELRDNAHPKPEARIGAREDVLGVDLVGRDPFLHPAVQGVELLGRDRLISGMPPDRVLAGGLLDEELVLRRPPRVLAGAGGQGAGGDDRGLASPHRLLVQRRRAEVPALGRDLVGYRHPYLRISNRPLRARTRPRPAARDSAIQVVQMRLKRRAAERAHWLLRERAAQEVKAQMGPHGRRRSVAGPPSEWATRFATAGTTPGAAACRSRSRSGCTRPAAPARRRTRAPC
jgi:hypothetical protein